MTCCERCNCKKENKRSNVCNDCKQIIAAAEKERNDISYRYMRKNASL